jgi:hypothetical protein
MLNVQVKYAKKCMCYCYTITENDHKKKKGSSVLNINCSLYVLQIVLICGMIFYMSYKIFLE